MFYVVPANHVPIGAVTTEHVPEESGRRNAAKEGDDGRLTYPLERYRSIAPQTSISPQLMGFPPSGSTRASTQGRSRGSNPNFHSGEAETAPGGQYQIAPNHTKGTGRLEPNSWLAKEGQSRPLLSHPSRYDGSDNQLASSAISEASSLVSAAGLETWSARKKEMDVIARMTIPIFITVLLEHSLTVASVIAIGHLSTLELAASALGSMTANVTGYAVIIGMICALDALLPQAWGSLDDDRWLVGLWAQRMVLVITATFVPVFLIWQKAEAGLLLLGQDPEVARLAGLYVSRATRICDELHPTKIYQAQGLLSVPTTVIMIFAPINAILNRVSVGSAPV